LARETYPPPIWEPPGRGTRIVSLECQKKSNPEFVWSFDAGDSGLGEKQPGVAKKRKRPSKKKKKSKGSHFLKRKVKKPPGGMSKRLWAFWGNPQEPTQRRICGLGESTSESIPLTAVYKQKTDKLMNPWV